MNGKFRSYKNHFPKVANTVYVDESAVLIGQVSLDDDASVWPLVAARGDVNTITVGKRSNIQDGAILHVTRTSEQNPNGHPLTIGDDVTVGHKAMLHGCTIGNRVLVGMGAIMLDGAIIEDDVILGAGSLVPPGKRLVTGFLYVGSPVKQTRPLSEGEIAFLRQSSDNYVKLKNDYLRELEV